MRRTLKNWPRDFLARHFQHMKNLSPSSPPPNVGTKLAPRGLSSRSKEGIKWKLTIDAIGEPLGVLFEMVSGVALLVMVGPLSGKCGNNF